MSAWWKNQSTTVSYRNAGYRWPAALTTSEVLRALADGRQVQFATGSLWHEFTNEMFPILRYFNNYDWRIVEPAPPPETIPLGPEDVPPGRFPFEDRLGLTKREEFAKAMMAARLVLGDRRNGPIDEYLAYEAQIATKATDALLAALEKPKD